MSLIFTSTKHLNLESFSSDIHQFLSIIPNDLFKCSYDDHGVSKYLNIETETFKIIVFFYNDGYNHWYLESKLLEDRAMIQDEKEKAIQQITKTLHTYQKHIDYINGLIKK